MELVPKSAEVIELPCITSRAVPCDRILENAKGKLQRVIIVGYDENDELWFASSEASGPSVLWDLHEAENSLMKIGKIL